MVVVPFPFSDLSQAKRRPALVLAELEGDDVILCQITSRAVRDRYAVPLDDGDFAEGGLRQPSNARPNRLFTADRAIVLFPAAGAAEREQELGLALLDRAGEGGG